MFGMKIAKGDYLIFLDSDDIFEQKMLEELFINNYYK
jgi:glycosyltransferase involved in cell wall biosynthesis